MNATPALPVPIGEIVAGKYRIERVLGQGGMGVVVSAMHEQLRQRVAIKMLLPEAKASPNAVARFLREARAAAAIHGEHVARVLDVGELAEGAPYIVLEYLEGEDLARVLRDGGPLSVEVAVGYVLQACEAIAEAHAAGIVHRDLKPSNLFLARRPDGSPLVKVLDFGISKALLAAGEGTLTTATSFVGSPVYAPPEQLLAAHDVDHRADFWSLGTILFEALAHRPPYLGDSAMHVASRIFHEPPASLADLRPDLPPELCAVVMRCLRKQPEDRPADVRELAEALAPFAPSAHVSAERVARILSTPSGRSPDALPADATSTSSPGRGARRVRVALVAVAAAGGVVLGFVGFSARRAPPPPFAAAARSGPSARPVLPAPAGSFVAAAAPAGSEAADGGASLAPPPSGASGTPAAPPRVTRTAPKKNPLSVGVK